MTIRWLMIRSGGASLPLASWAGCSLTSNTTSAGSSLCKITGSLRRSCSWYRIPTKYVNAGPVSKFSNKNRPSASVCPGNRCTSWLGPKRISIIRCSAKPFPSRCITPRIRPTPSVRPIWGNHPITRALQINPIQNKRHIVTGWPMTGEGR